MVHRKGLHPALVLSASGAYKDQGSENRAVKDRIANVHSGKLSPGRLPAHFMQQLGARINARNKSAAILCSQILHSHPPKVASSRSRPNTLGGCSTSNGLTTMIARIRALINAHDAAIDMAELGALLCGVQ
jgi:hypothetical protein